MSHYCYAILFFLITLACQESSKHYDLDDPLTKNEEKIMVSYLRKHPNNEEFLRHFETIDNDIKILDHLVPDPMEELDPPDEIKYYPEALAEWETKQKDNNHKIKLVNDGLDALKMLLDYILLTQYEWKKLEKHSQDMYEIAGKTLTTYPLSTDQITRLLFNNGGIRQIIKDADDLYDLVNKSSAFQAETKAYIDQSLSTVSEEFRFYKSFLNIEENIDVLEELILNDAYKNAIKHYNTWKFHKVSITAMLIIAHAQEAVDIIHEIDKDRIIASELEENIKQAIAKTAVMFRTETSNKTAFYYANKIIYYTKTIMQIIQDLEKDLVEQEENEKYQSKLKHLHFVIHDMMGYEYDLDEAEEDMQDLRDPDIPLK